MSRVDSTKHSKVSNRLHYWVRYLTLGRPSVNCVSLVLTSCCKIHTILEFLPFWYCQLKYGFCKKLLWLGLTLVQMIFWPVEHFCPHFFPDQHWSGQKVRKKGFNWSKVRLNRSNFLANKQGIWIKQGSSFIR